MIILTIKRTIKRTISRVDLEAIDPTHDLSNVEISNMSLKGINLSSTNLQDANLTDVVGLKLTNLKGRPV